jgi:predicted acyl esterase
VLIDEYTDEELAFCVQVISQIAAHPACDGNVGMMGKSWSAINSLMVAARPDRPRALKAVLVCCGSDDRYNDDVHYMGGAMMFDNVSWPSSMWGWMSLPPDPAVVGDPWKEMWRERIRNADFWFKQWASNQPRDDYWAENSVRGHFEDVQVPVFVMSGWQDGYKNPVERVVSGLSALGKPVQGLLGPWGHKYPFGGYPGPRIAWLQYTVTHWWDKWLKGKTPPPATDWPELPVWLSESQGPSKSLCPDEKGKWVAEDGAWRSRVKEKVLYLGPGNRLGDAPGKVAYSSAKPLVLDTEMLETSSWGECGNDDLPGDQARFDKASLYFDSEPLPDDLDIFGYPTVALTLAVNRPTASLSIRLCELEPETKPRTSSPIASTISPIAAAAWRALRKSSRARPSPCACPSTSRATPLRRAGASGLRSLPDAVADRRRADRHAVRRRRRRLRGERPHAAGTRAEGRGQGGAKAAAGNLGDRIRQSRRLSADARRDAGGEIHARRDPGHHRRQARNAGAQSVRQRPLSIWRAAAGLMDRPDRRREFPDDR